MTVNAIMHTGLTRDSVAVKLDFQRRDLANNSYQRDENHSSDGLVTIRIIISYVLDVAAGLGCQKNLKGPTTRSWRNLSQGGQSARRTVLFDRDFDTDFGGCFNFEA